MKKIAKGIKILMMNVVMGFVDFLEKLQKKLLPPQFVLLNFAIGNIAIHKSICVSVELGIADLLREGPKSIEQLAKDTGTDADALNRIMRTLTSSGIFRAKKDGLFETNRLGIHLQSDQEDSMYAFIKIVGEDWISGVWDDLTETTKSGKDSYEIKYGINFFEWLRQNNEAQEEFDVGMTSISAMSDVPIAETYDFSRFKSIVDVGGGYGSQIINILKRNPEMNGILFDLPATIGLVRKDGVSDHAGLDGRLEYMPGDFFDSVPAGYDLYFMKSILHDWHDEKAIKILSTCRKAMRDDSVMLIVENVVKDDYNQPDFSKALDINVLALMGGKVRTRGEYSDILKEAGLELKRVIQTPSPFSLIEAKPI